LHAGIHELASCSHVRLGQRTQVMHPKMWPQLSKITGHGHRQNESRLTRTAGDTIRWLIYRMLVPQEIATSSLVINNL
jgi:hypothetical protein